MPNRIIKGRHLLESLNRLTPAERSQVHGLAASLRDGPPYSGGKPKRVKRAPSEDVWAGRASGKLRVILFRDGDTWALLYADHHDAAYTWARQHKIGPNEFTGELQIEATPKTLRDLERQERAAAQPAAVPIFATHSDELLLSYGVPANYLPTLRAVHDDLQLLRVCDTLQMPVELTERLNCLATGVPVTPPPRASLDQPLINRAPGFYEAPHDEELAAVLDAPMERWMAFLHSSQRSLVESRFSGPVKVSGSPGTGKTVVAMHRARHLARSGERVLLTSFSKTLTANLDDRLELLCTHSERRLITVATVHRQALELIKHIDPGIRAAPDDAVPKLLEKHGQQAAPQWDKDFLCAEWLHVVRAQGIQSWEAYRDLERTGRSRPLGVRERETLWKVFGAVLGQLERLKLLDWPGMAQRAHALLAQGKVHSPYTAVIVDEVQDLRTPDLKFLQALCAAHPGNLMLCGDAGQRIFPGGFSLSELGIEVRGRSRVLRLNYRTTEPIRRLAAEVRGPDTDDMDGGMEDPDCARSLRAGPAPVLQAYPDLPTEVTAAVMQIREWLNRGRPPAAIAAFARTEALATHLRKALADQGVPARRLGGSNPAGRAAVNVDTMDNSKGLEFQAVLLLSCSAAVLPHASARRDSAEPEDRQSAHARERNLLYVAMTRARDELVVSWSGERSPFVPQLKPS